MIASKIKKHFPFVNISCLLIFLVPIVSCVPPTQKETPTASPWTDATPPPTTVPASPSTSTTIPPSNTPFILEGCVTAYSLRVRKGPDTNFDMIGGLQKDDCIQIIGRNKNADWGLIDFEGLRGWASLEYISTSGNLRNLPIVKGEFNQTITPILTTATITFTPLPSLTNTPRPSPTKDILNCKDADQHIGSYVTCKMPQAYCSYNPDVSGDPTFCNDAPYPGHSFTLVIWEKDASYLDGRCLLVSGFVSSYQGKPQIEMEDTSGVSFCK